MQSGIHSPVLTFTFTGIPAKLRGRAGESIAETLVALLIGCVALVMLAGMISTSAHLITKSKTLMNEYYLNNDTLEKKSGSTSGELTITIKKTSAGTLPDKKYTANYYTNDKISGKPVISYLFKSDSP